MAPPSPATLPLLPSQLGLWLGHALSSAGHEYTVAEEVRLCGPLFAWAMREALTRVTAEAEALTLRVAADGQTQWVGAAVEVSELDLSADAEPEASARAHLQDDFDAAVDLSRGPTSRWFLIKLAPEEHLLVLRSHHVAIDGYGLALVWERLAHVYSALVDGSTPTATPFSSLMDLAEDERSYQSGAQRQADREFFSRRLADGSPRARSAPGFRPPARGRKHGAAWQGDCPPRVEGAHAVHVVAAAFVHEIAARAQRHRLVLGIPMLARVGRDALRTPITLMNLVPLQLTLRADQTVAETAQQLATGLRDLKPHGCYRHEDLRRDLGLDARDGNLFDAVINILPFSRRLRFAHLSATHARLLDGPVDSPTLTIPLAAGGAVESAELCLHPEDAASCPPSALLEGITERLRQPHRAHTCQPLSTSRLLGPALKSAAPDVLARLLAIAETSPQHAAIEQEALRLTYGDVVEEVARLGRGLIGLEVQPGDLIALALPRSPDAILAMLAVLSVGAAYLPLDPDGPIERNRRVLSQARPKLLVHHATATAALGELASGVPTTTTVALREQAGAAAPLSLPSRESPADGLAYVIFTSGSTGTPNGVEIERGALSHFVNAAIAAYGLGPSDRVLQFAGLHFDASVEEIFCTLCSGGTLVLRTDAMADSLPDLLAGCAQAGVTVADLPTALFHELAVFIDDGTELPETLRTVIIGGEAALPAATRRFLAHAPAGLRLFNTYGPTECSVVATVYALDKDAAATLDQVPIGAPLAGLTAMVVDGQLQAVAVGQQGELCLAGPVLARGYRFDPELTGQRFMEVEGMRAYRTGDRVRQTREGQLLFEGRIDDELKISGHRIDPRQVEHALCELPEIDQAVVLPLSSATPRVTLSAALVARPGAMVADADVRSALASALLPAAIPRHFLWLDALPRNRNGKVDKKRLREVLEQAQKSHDARPTWVPQAGLESQVARAWREVLELPQLRLEDDFFALGGQSLQAIALVSRLSKQLGRAVPATLLFKRPQLSDFLSALRGEGSRLPEPTFAQDVVLPADVRPSGQQDAGSARVVVTGGTGFVGRSILRALLEHPDAPELVCLVRAHSDDAAERRIMPLLPAALHCAWARRGRALRADVAKPGLGLSQEAYAQLAASGSAVIHAAASVSLLRDYASLRAENVDATVNVLRLVTQGRPKALHHVSTLAVTMGLPESLSTEAFVEAHEGLQDGYQQSKWAAEELVRKALARGIAGRVYRLGRVVPDPMSEAADNPQDLLHRVLRLGLSRNCLPKLDVEEVWTPAGRIGQVLARAALATLPVGHRPVVHLCDPGRVHLATFFESLSSLRGDLPMVAPPEFRARVGAARSEEEAATLAFFDLQADRPMRHGVSAARGEFAALATELGCAIGPTLADVVDAESRRTLSLERPLSPGELRTGP